MCQGKEQAAAGAVSGAVERRQRQMQAYTESHKAQEAPNGVRVFCGQGVLAIVGRWLDKLADIDVTTDHDLLFHHLAAAALNVQK